MPEFRYQSIGPSGRMVQGFLSAPSRREAQKRAAEVCRRERLRLGTLQRKATFFYKVQRGTEAPVKGETTAYTREEVEGALRKANYRVLQVRKKVLEFRLKPPANDIVLFIRMCADMVREGLEYNEVLSILADDTQNKTLADAVRHIQQNLKDGKEGREVYGEHEDVFGRFVTYMLSVASTTGNMAAVYDSTAKFLERDQEFKRSLRSALITPTITLIVLMGAVVYYVGWIFPATAQLFLRFGVDLRDQAPWTYGTMLLSDWLQTHYLVVLLVLLSTVMGVLLLWRTERVRFLLDRFIIRLPVIGPLFHKTSVEIFSRVFHALYSGAGQNIGVIRTAAEACRNRYIEQQVKEVAIPLMLREGRGLVESLEATGAFPQTAIARLRSGQESGSMRATALQLADYYEKETTYKLRNAVEVINIMIAMVIMMVMVAVTLLSAETAVVSPKHPMMR